MWLLPSSELILHTENLRTYVSNGGAAQNIPYAKENFWMANYSRVRDVAARPPAADNEGR
ncbi:hypothetical protein Shyd_07040 [Streptomyces hydrogenans]|uniref:Uncharacterized protein n=1 Tax=Streptomyces hydrogenans TaxID=1873719 RepID=A0ABQ3P2U5_9ACTN|nr:hypothetical protein GCM10018784_55580 [Streptomyces hydrogenans]GHI19333.1 hypothetical protein Shyd_07040 [Streptomyces hydrogenans]